MDSVNFQEIYRETYSRLGFELAAKDGVPKRSLEKAEKKLGAKLPDALRQYYLVAGQEKVLNHAFNRLLPSNEFEMHHGKLPFMEENQCVVIWGLTLRPDSSSDPNIFQGPIANGEARKWHLECDRCSTFLVFMLHVQAAYGGGMALSASAPLTDIARAKLDATWHFGGEVNGMRTYSRSGQAVCVVKMPALKTKTETLEIIAGASSEAALAQIEKDLAVHWDYRSARRSGSK